MVYEFKIYNVCYRLLLAGCPPAKGGDAFFTITPRLQVHDYSVSAGFWKPCDHTLSAGNRRIP